MMSGSRNRIGLTAVLATAILALGLAVNLGFTRPQQEEFRRLAQQRAAARGQLAALEIQELQSRDLAAGLGGEDLRSALQAQNRTDLVGFLSNTILQSGLTRLEMSTQSSAEENHLRRTHFFLHLSGTYASTVDFVRRLEQGPRLVTIESLALEMGPEATALDVRIELSVYELTREVGR